MIHISIDPGNKTGYAIWNNNKLIESGLFESDNHDRYILEIIPFLNSIIKKYNIKHLTIEHPVNDKFGMNPIKTGIKVGLILGWATCNKITFIIINPAVWCKCLGVKKGKSKKKKLDTMEAIKVIYGEKHSYDNNIADAIGIGHYYIQLCNKEGDKNESY